MNQPHDLSVLNGEKPGTYVLVAANEAPERDTPALAADFLRVLRKHKGLIGLLGIGGLICGIAFVLPQPPVYRSAASIEVQAPNDDFLYSRDVNPNASMGSMFPDFDMATQVRILGTRSLLDRVVAKLDSDPTIPVRVPESRLSAWRKALHLPPGSAMTRRDVIASAAGTLKVQSARGSRVIEIDCESQDPQLTAVFLNTLAHEYIEQSIERRWQTAQHTGAWLERQLDEIKIKLERSEDQMQTYAAAANLVLTGDKDKTNVADEKLSELQKELGSAQADRIVKQARYELASSGRADSMSQVMDDASLRAYELKLAELRRALAEASQSFGPAHVSVKKLQAQIAQTEADAKKSREKLVERIYNDFREAERREKLLNADYQTQSSVLSAQAGKLTHYNILKREADINRQLYESLLQKVKESGISAALRASNIQVIDTAQPPFAPSGPNMSFAAICGLLFGLTGGAGIASVRERLNRAITAPGDAATHLNVPELGVIPSYSVDRSIPAGLALPLATYTPAGQSKALIPQVGKQSLMAESFRALLTSILYIGRKRPTKVIVVCSPGAGEGKTTIISNLALAFAETNRSVLAIDCDLRKPKLHRIFDIANDEGLAQLLAEKEPLDGAGLLRRCRTTPYAGVCVLPSGSDSEGSAALLHSIRLQELISLARNQFDVILIDTPPLMHLADARIVGSLVDGVVLVVRSGQTSRDSLASVKQRLGEDGIPILGVALNDWNPKAAGYYGYENYADYYNSYYGPGKNA